jgi:ATP-dependent DNA ligase
MMDLEGIVSKRIGSRYVSGRTRAWLKMKNPDQPQLSRTDSKQQSPSAGVVMRD